MANPTITELQDQLNNRNISSVELCREYLDRINQLNATGPELRAIIEVNEEALSEAASLDRERRERGSRGPLHGIPVAVKDNIDTAGTMQTTAGSLALVGKPALRDACIIEKLRSAGAIILAKTNLSEWANFRSTKSSSGWSSRGGQCLNPYDLTRSPCGSSSGSAVAVAAGMVPVAIGTETDGSIICPSAMNSLVGIKPTMGLVSRNGIIPIAHSQDTAGPIASCVADAVLLLAAVSGSDPQDVVTMDSPLFRSARSAALSYLSGLMDTGFPATRPVKGLQGIRVGIAKNMCGFDYRVDRIFEEHIRQMEKCGAVIIDSCSVPEIGSYDKEEMAVLLYEFKSGLNAYLRQRDNTVSVHSLEDIIAFNNDNPNLVMPYFGQELLIQAQEKGSLDSAEYRRALDTCREKSGKEGLRHLFDGHMLDILAAPANGPSWKIDHVNGDRYTGGNSSPAAVAGYPSITIPAGYISGLPIGTSLIGRPFSEAALIPFAYKLEQLFPVRMEPRLQVS